MPTKLARMHTAEHLLSAVMQKHFAAPRNLELHLGEKKTKCDYQPQTPLTDGDVEKIATWVNQEIGKNHPVSERVLRRDAAQAYDLWKVPEDAEEIRIIEIGDFDAQPCSGEHVANTGEIGRFRIISHDVRDNGRVRIRFKVE